ncbi:MAG: hypothetical protein QXO40_02475 [Candidatus Aenigmatarchaeota archaeon]
MNTNLFRGVGINFKDYTDRFDGRRFSGYANYLSFFSYFRNLSLNLFFKENSEGFIYDTGYIERNNFKTRRFGVAPIFYPNRFGILEFSIPIEYSKETNFEGILKDSIRIVCYMLKVVLIPVFLLLSLNLDSFSF